MQPSRLAALTTASMIAFAGNSLLCRLALGNDSIDASSFTAIRLASGAAALWLLTRRRTNANADRGSWRSALALFAYAAGFSFAYVSLPAATGALLLFGAVQATMIGHGLLRGERLRAAQVTGLLLALGGLVALVLPGLAAPDPLGAALMLAAGVAWGTYSLRGRGTGDPTRITASNFARSIPFALLLGAAFAIFASDRLAITAAGGGYAIASGALTSGLGYALWYAVLPAMRATTAATIQLSVPVLTALGGVLLLGEALSPRLVACGLTILGGIALVLRARN